MLQAVAPSRAVEYFLSVYDQVPQLDEMMQLSVIELIRKESKAGGSGATEGALKVRSLSPRLALRTSSSLTPSRARAQARYIKCIFELLNSGSHSVKYEAAATLTTLTQNPAAVKGASSPARARTGSGPRADPFPAHCTQPPPPASSRSSCRSLLTTSR